MLTKISWSRLTWLAVVAIIAACALPANPAWARRGGGGGMKMPKTSGGGGGGGQIAAPTQKPVDPALKNAEADLNKAEQALEAVVAKLHAAFVQGADYTQAKADSAAAQTAYEAAKKSVLEELAATPAYQAALEEKKKAQADRDATKSTASTGDDAADAGVATAKAQAVLDAAGKVTTLETDACAADATVTAARAKADAASNAITKLEQQFNASIKDNADWQTAKKDVDAAKAKLDAIASR